MTVPNGIEPDNGPGNNGPIDNGNPDPNQNPGHPAWQEILDVLPTDLHGLVTPTLKKWDEGVAARLNEIKQQYDPYKGLVENKVDPQFAEQALWLAVQMNNDPRSVVERAIEHFNLEEFKRTQEEDNDVYSSDPDDPDYDLENDPRYKALADKQRELEEWANQQRSREQQEQASTELQNYLKTLHDQHGAFDDLYVTALVSQGIDGEVAVEQFRNTVNQAAQALTGNQAPPPPVVMGAGGTTGSGTPDTPVNFGQMSTGDINDIVTQMLERAQEQS